VFGINQLKQTIEIENADLCSLCQECTKFADELGLPSKSVQVNENDRKFLFTVESTGALPPEEIVVRSMKILQSKLDFLREGL
jgi:DNA-directed RNA polymerase II subunit RPB3